jgi:hypothetical protein
MPISPTGSSGSPSSTLPPPDVPGDSGLAADAQKEDRARLKAYQKTMSDLDNNRSTVSDMKAYEKVTQKEIDDLQQEYQNEVKYLSQNPGLSPAASSEVRAEMQGQLTQIREIMQQRDSLAMTEALKAQQWQQQYTDIAPSNSGSGSNAAATPVSAGQQASAAPSNSGAGSTAGATPTASPAAKPRSSATPSRPLP